MLRRLYDWTLSFADTRYALAALAVVAFVESSVFPIPPDVLLIPMVLAARNRAWFFATVCTVFSVAGGCLGYYIGAELFEQVGQPVLDFYHKGEHFAAFSERFNAYGPWVVLFAGVTPFPYKVITITSGATGLDFWVFLTASTVARALRFFLVAGLLWYFGPVIRTFIDRYFGWVATAAIILLFGGFYAVKYL
ncbi:YqaA family protein [Oceanomicrobium pacificus]|uniref:DedA family protein n=1 Tax=Oceanomicrobium pacificus TaxID=2692916 RepID=A0A6B0TN22_9RHOB|nr:YqaA family protein [Oceanomicrobium pacificus]MXU65927.1 DedA family protein [Oceanomicrobium pacificus]